MQCVRTQCVIFVGKQGTRKWKSVLRSRIPPATPYKVLFPKPTQKFYDDLKRLKNELIRDHKI